MMERPPYQSAGSASIADTGTVQRRFVLAPQITRATAKGSRTMNGMGTAAQVPFLPTLLARTCGQRYHASGSRTNETATTAAVDSSATASEPHSRRTTNHSSPIPGAIFVRSTNDQAAGQRNPSTIATATSSSMLPPQISINPKKARPRKIRRGPVM